MDVRIEKKFCFIIGVRNNQNTKRCLKAIELLKVPEGYGYEIFQYEINGDINSALSYNSGYRCYKGKYKIYLDDNICIINQNFLSDILALFLDEQVGAIGITGITQRPMCDQALFNKKLVGAYSTYNELNVLEEHSLSSGIEQAANVQGLDGSILITQYDLWWDLYNIKTGKFNRMMQSFKYVNTDYKAVVPHQDVPWCIVMDDNLPLLQELHDKYLSRLAYNVLPPQMQACFFYSADFTSKIGKSYELAYPEHILLGSRVEIGDNCRLIVNQAMEQDCIAISVKEKTRIGNWCQIIADTQVVIDKFVTIGSNVLLKDRYIELSLGRDVTEKKQGLYIGRHAEIGDNVVIAGAYKIGKGCIILPNTTVMCDIPDYCVVGGSPARIIKVFDYRDGKWLAVDSQEKANTLLAKRATYSPIITLGIPTYNRSYYLEKTLAYIMPEVGNDNIYEVLISDNASEDDTSEIVKKYQSQYSNIRYHRNSENIGGRNFEKVWEIANGEYVIALGDDDYPEEGGLYQLIKMLYSNRKAAVVAMVPDLGEYDISVDLGLDAYLAKVSHIGTSISSFAFKHDYYMALEDKLKWGETHLNQVYLQLELIKRHESFSVLRGDIWRFDCGEAGYGNRIPYKDRYGFCSIFIKEYFDIVSSFLQDGLSEEALHRDKAYVFNHLILPCLKSIKKYDWQWSIDDNILELYDEYFYGEPYYLAGKSRIIEIKDN